jgi:hypothetical protein
VVNFFFHFEEFKKYISQQHVQRSFLGKKKEKKETKIKQISIFKNKTHHISTIGSST